MRFLITILILFNGHYAVAENPVLVIQGYSQFKDINVYRTGRVLVVQGRLLDDLKQGISNQRIEVRQGQHVHVLSTDATGVFRDRLQWRQQKVSIVYAGVASMVGTQLDNVVVAEPSPTLQINAPERAPIHEEFVVSAELRTDDRSVPKAELILESDDTQTACTTDRKGRCQWRLTSAQSGLQSIRVMWTGISPRLSKEKNIDIQRPINAKMVIHGLSEEEDGTHLIVELVVLKPGPEKTIGSIRINGITLESKRLDTSTRFRIPWTRLRDGDNSISARVRSMDFGWSPVVLPEQEYERPDQWLASRWPSRIAWGFLFICTSLLGIRLYRSRRQLEIRPSPPPELPPIASFELNPNASKGSGFQVTIVSGETNVPLQAHVTASRNLVSAETARVHSSPGLDARQTDVQGRLELHQAPPALLIQGENRVSVACAVPEGSHAVRIAMWRPRGYAQRAFMGFLKEAGFPRLTFGRDTPREAGRVLKDRGYDAHCVEEVVDQIENICFGADAISVKDVLLFEESVKRLSQGAAP